MYTPDPYNDSSGLGIYLRKELEKLSNSLTNIEVENVSFKVWNVEPDKPRVGQLYFADGTNWNPSGGEGLYQRLSSGWSKL